MTTAAAPAAPDAEGVTNRDTPGGGQTVAPVPAPVPVPVPDRDAAFGRVRRVLGTYARRYAAWAGVDPTDLYQDAAARFLSAWHTFRPPDHPGHVARRLTLFAFWCVRWAAEQARRWHARRWLAPIERAKAAVIAAAGPDTGIPASDAEHDPDGPEPNVMLVKLTAALGRLRPRDRATLAARFGLGGGRPLTLREAAAAAGVTHQAIGQRVATALRRLRDLLGDR